VANFFSEGGAVGGTHLFWRAANIENPDWGSLTHDPMVAQPAC
jgi:hypothetical protein|tara:strand:+ start:185 stop:313 length:129 start_codon:yes stop_codon:yes gene_type:complete